MEKHKLPQTRSNDKMTDQVILLDDDDDGDDDGDLTEKATVKLKRTENNDDIEPTQPVSTETSDSASDLTIDQSIVKARDTVLSMVDVLRCHACNSRFIAEEVDQGYDPTGDERTATVTNNSKPWRSRDCEHLLCASCATLKAIPSGMCPVASCRVPTRPMDVVQDFVTGQVIDACVQLANWAYHAKNVLSSGQGQGHGCEESQTTTDHEINKTDSIEEQHQQQEKQTQTQENTWPNNVTKSHRQPPVISQRLFHHEKHHNNSNNNNNG